MGKLKGGESCLKETQVSSAPSPVKEYHADLNTFVDSPKKMLSLKRIVIGWHVKVHYLPAVTPVTIVTITAHDNHPPMARSRAWIRATAATVMVIAVEEEGGEAKIKGVEVIRMLQGRGGMIGRCVRWGHD